MICIPDLGHFIPITRIAEELARRGHKVTFIVPKFAYEDRKKLTDSIGCLCISTDDDLKDGELMPMKNNT
jgi:hypothetical protein